MVVQSIASQSARMCDKRNKYERLPETISWSDESLIAAAGRTKEVLGVAKVFLRV